MPIVNVTGRTVKPLIRGKAWKERRIALMKARGKPALMDTQPPCRSERGK